MKGTLRRMVWLVAGAAVAALLLAGLWEAIVRPARGLRNACRLASATEVDQALRSMPRSEFAVDGGCATHGISCRRADTPGSVWVYGSIEGSMCFYFDSDGGLYDCAWSGSGAGQVTEPACSQKFRFAQ
jgi:hypothetical protein